MYTEAKKLHIIEEVLKVDNDAILIELEKILFRSNALKPKKHFSSFLDKLSPEEIKELERNIENGCEQINEDDWK
jgi:hypothetical protein